jgi:hypothetical protein
MTLAPAAAAFSEISFAVAAWPDEAGISTTERRGRRTFNLSRPAARAIKRSSGRTHRPYARKEFPCVISLPIRRTPCPGIASPNASNVGPAWFTASESITQSQASGMRSPASTQTGDLASGNGE